MIKKTSKVIVTVIFILSIFLFFTSSAKAVMSPPSNLVAESALDHISLTWTDNSLDETKFTIRRHSSDYNWAKIAEVAANTISYSDYSVQIGVRYWYVINAEKIGEQSAGSNIVSAVAGPKPSKPTSLIATATSATQINLTWTDNADNELGFKIERADAYPNFTPLKSLAANVTIYSDTGLQENHTYYYRVKAYNDPGDSEYSNEANATTFSAVPNIKLTKSVNKTQIQLGETVTYTITYQNIGYAEARYFIIEDPIDTNLLNAQTINYITGSGVYNPLSHKIFWNLGNIAVGASGQVSFSIQQGSTPAMRLPIGTVQNVAMDPVYPQRPYAYVASKEYGLVVVDLSNQSAPKIIAYQDKPMDASQIGITNNKHILISGDFGSRVINVSDPFNPQTISAINLELYVYGGGIDNIRTIGNYAYLGGAKISLIDLNNPANPQIINQITSPNRGIWDMDLADNTLFASSLTPRCSNNCFIFYSANPPNPMNVLWVGLIPAVIASTGDYTYIVSNRDGAYSGLGTYNTRDKTNPIFIREESHSFGKVADIETSGNIVALSADAAGQFNSSWIVFYDKTNPENPIIKSHFENFNEHKNPNAKIAIFGNKVAVADGAGGLYVVDASDLLHPVEISRLSDF